MNEDKIEIKYKRDDITLDMTFDANVDATEFIENVVLFMRGISFHNESIRSALMRNEDMLYDEEKGQEL